jgi:hypothetical protein
MPENKVSLYRIEKDDLKSLFDHFKQSHYKIIGHIYRDGALMLDEIDSFEEMATGYDAIQSAGTFKLEKKDSESLFQYTVGPQSFKKYLYPPKRKLWSAEKDGKTFKIQKIKEKPPKMVFWGIRSCEIKAIEILDRIFIKGEYVNDWYKEAREKLILVGVNCTNPSSTCFCTTTRSGPKIKTDHDISITELIDKEKPSYVISLPEHAKTLNIDIKAWKKASKEEIDQAEERIGQAADKMKLKFQPQDAVQTLKNNLEHYHWEEVA